MTTKYKFSCLSNSGQVFEGISECCVNLFIFMFTVRVTLFDKQGLSLQFNCPKKLCTVDVKILNTQLLIFDENKDKIVHSILSGTVSI